MTLAPLILVVDDNALNRELMISVLQAFEYRSLAVNSGKKALQIAQEEQPSVIVSDINMPNMDGYELIHQLKSLPSTAKIPIILMSGIQGSAHDRQRAIEAGAAALFIRGSKVTELAAIIKRLLSDD